MQKKTIEEVNEKYELEILKIVKQIKNKKAGKVSRASPMIPKSLSRIRFATPSQRKAMVRTPSPFWQQRRSRWVKRLLDTPRRIPEPEIRWHLQKPHQAGRADHYGLARDLTP